MFRSLVAELGEVEEPAAVAGHVAHPGVLAGVALPEEHDAGDALGLGGVGSKIGLVDAQAALLSDGEELVGPVGPEVTPGLQAWQIVPDSGEEIIEVLGAADLHSLGVGQLLEGNGRVDEELEIGDRKAAGVVEESPFALRFHDPGKAFGGGFVPPRDGFRIDEVMRPSGGEGLVKNDTEGDGETGELKGVSSLVAEDAAEDLQGLWVIVIGGEGAQEGVTDGRFLSEGNEGAA